MCIIIILCSSIFIVHSNNPLESIFDAVNTEVDKKESKEKRGRKMSSCKWSTFMHTCY